MASAADKQWTVKDLLTWTAGWFGEKGLDEPLLCAQLLLAEALGCTKVDLYVRYAEVIDMPTRDAFRALVKRAASGEPISYIRGTKDFFSLEFEVNPSVLIPRPESEVLVEWLVHEVRNASNEGPVRILELATGSGCIAVSLAKFLPGSFQITATDISEAALQVARANAERHEVSDKIEFLQGDLFTPVEAGRRFDLIVANLPYVTTTDYEALPVHIRKYEPRDALEAGADGLDVIRCAIAGAGEFLEKGGRIVLEIGYNQRDAVEQLLSEHGFKAIAFVPDGAGIARVAVGRIKETT